MTINSQELPTFNLDVQVLTTEHNPDIDGWTAEALGTRRWGVAGIITALHNSHGLSYEVTHSDDLTVGHYDPTEIESI